VTDLLPPHTRSAGHCDADPVWTGPRYARTRGMSRWHRVRSGIRFRPGSGAGGADGRTVWRLWCGQVVNDAASALETDRPAPGEPACGTCEGQALGAGRDDNPLDVDLVFEPRGLNPPVWCPGGGHRGAWVALAPSVGRCLVCGLHGTLRWRHYPNTGQTFERHHTGSDVIEPCPSHAWDALRERGGVAACWLCDGGSVL
jgi:hypothetical protein